MDKQSDNVNDIESIGEVQVIDLTKKLAQMLTRKIPTFQRTVKPGQVRNLKEAMDEGQFSLTQDAIIVRVEKDGEIVELENGQHRCLARAKSTTRKQCPVMLLTKPADVKDEEKFDVYLKGDQGVKRTFADYLKVLDVKQPKAKESLTAFMLTVQKGSDARSRKSLLQLKELWETLDQERLSNCLNYAVGVGYSLGFQSAKTPIAAKKYFLEEEGVDIPGFWSQLHTGIVVQDLQNALNVRNFMNKWVIENRTMGRADGRWIFWQVLSKAVENELNIVTEKITKIDPSASLAKPVPGWVVGE